MPSPVAPAPAATTTPAPPPVTSAPKVVATDQHIQNGAVTIASVFSPGAGWLVVHNQVDGKTGADIGHAAVITGTNENVRVGIDTGKATPTLYAMLHVDAGAVGKYEFPGADVPVTFQGSVVNVPFKAQLPSLAAAVTVQDQVLKDGSVKVSVVVSNGPGWLVIHAQKDGKTGPDIGHAALSDGLNKDVVVKLDPGGVTNVLYAMLHTDAGAVGTYEFPGADVPVSQSGHLVNKPFRVHPASESPVVRLEPVAQGLVAPIALVSPADGTGRMFIVDQVGTISILPKAGPMMPEPFLDLRSKLVSLSARYDERGLLGLAFHNDFKTNGKFYVFYSVPLRSGAPAGYNHTSRISEFRVSRDNPNKADLSSERVILEIDKPQSNHNGGPIAMGPDGYLYIPTGDGGSANDAGLGHNPTIGNGQDTGSLHGKILRIDVDSAAPGLAYGIPRDNPFADGAKGRPEIYAYGLRNPYLLTFDKGGDHELFVGMAGQNRWESLWIIKKGANYGWRIREGSHCFDPATGNDLASGACPTTGAAGEPLALPIVEYPNAAGPGGYGVTAIGGQVYRGQAMPHLAGRYLFVEFSRGFTEPGDGILFVGTRLDAAGDAWTFEEVTIAGRPNGRIGAFARGIGQDADGELYLLTSSMLGPGGATGAVYRLAAAGRQRRWYRRRCQHRPRRPRP